MDDVYRDRIAALTRIMGERGVRHLWVEPSTGFRYLTGHLPISMERLTGLLVSAEGNVALLSPTMLAQELDGITEDVRAWDDSEGPTRATAGILDGVDKLHVQGSLAMWMFDALRSSASVDIDVDPGCMSSLREHKDLHEVDILRRSAKIADDTQVWISTQDVRDLTENQLRGRIRAHFLELGVDPSPPLVATGANAAMPHYEGGDVEILPDRPLLCDFGAALDGYWSDITRVFMPNGIEDQVSKAYEVVCAAYDAAFAAVAPGVRCRDVDAAARKVIDDAGLGDRFIHRTGHGVGLDVHEPPFLDGGNDAELEVGHVFSIEPGVYVPGGFGLRYENLVYLGPDGPEALNRAPRYLRLGAEAG
ncbi:MAG TPA: Xaa-Pro peptidase family protein [Actinomycetota bacterium]|nr:Xaa-Pro peptidase family protein [Actinomycetota bacterium]